MRIIHFSICKRTKKPEFVSFHDHHDLYWQLFGDGDGATGSGLFIIQNMPYAVRC